MEILYLGGNGGATPLIKRQILYIHQTHTDMCMFGKLFFTIFFFTNLTMFL